ncbi:MAG: hypothetical protein IPG97_18620 [Microthrixaceae bacterium]|jgi:hypothetical protein|nr:hypothetical protein [Microthrixaceae bacterium]
MFVQVIESHTDQPDRVAALVDRWERDLRPGAHGYIGSTGGVASDGRFVVMARFVDRDAAQANAARPEQSAWWTEMEACLDGNVTFHETDDVVEMRNGDAQKAGFVQVMEGHVTDRDRAVALEHEMEDLLPELRPDLLGTTTAYFSDGAYAAVAYFSSENEARRREKDAMPDSLARQFEEWTRLQTVDEYIDLTQPILIRA